LDDTLIHQKEHKILQMFKRISFDRQALHALLSYDAQENNPLLEEFSPFQTNEDYSKFGL